MTDDAKAPAVITDPIGTAIASIDNAVFWLQNLANYLDRSGLSQVALVMDMGGGAIGGNAATLRRCAQALRDGEKS